MITKRGRSGRTTERATRAKDNDSAITGRKTRRPAVVLGATIVVCLCVGLASESRILLATIKWNVATGGLKQSPPVTVNVLQEHASSDPEKDFVILEALVPPSHSHRLYEDTQHSHTSPLSPQSQGRKDPQHYNLQPYAGCQPTSKIHIIHTKQSQNLWILQTFQADGTPKAVGGDEFYVTFTSYADVNRTVVEDPVTHLMKQHPSLVAIPTDLANGNYSLEFFQPPAVEPEWHHNNNNLHSTDTGHLTVYLTYTCAMGMVTQKSDWKSRGSLDWVYHSQPNIVPPPWKPFQAPSLPKRLSSYDYVAAFGDSVLGLFVGQYRGNQKFNRYPRHWSRWPSHEQLHFKDNFRRPFVNHTKEIQELFQKWHGKRLAATSNAAILLGSGTWDLGTVTRMGGDEFFSLEPTVKAYQEFWQWLAAEYPGVDLYWKSLSAYHPHNLIDLQTHVEPANLERILRGTKYGSASRVQGLDRALRELIREQFDNRIAILDIYQATSLTAEWLFPADTHHYRWEMNRHMLMEWFY